MEVLVPIFIVLFIGLAVFGLVQAAKRRKALAAWAAGRGLYYQHGKDRTFGATFPGFKKLNQGHSRYAHNIMTGKWYGMDMVAFDYHYKTGSGKNESTHTFSAVIVESPIVLKPLYIRRESFFDKIAEFVGLDDIDFESAEFSRKFYVKASDRKFAYDVIHQRMIEYLLTAPSMNVQFDLMHVMASRGRRFGPAEFEAAAEHIHAIMDLLPDYLVRQQRELSGRTR